MTDREALIEAMKCLQDLYAIVRKLADRISEIERVFMVRTVDSPSFNKIAAGYQRECAAKDLRLTDEQIREIEAEIQSKNSEDGTC